MFEMKLRKQLFLNLLLGSMLYVVINMIGLSINLNYITASCIAFLGMPGVVLVVVLKLILQIF